MMKSVFMYSRLMGIALLLIAPSLEAYAAPGPYAPVPIASRAAQVMWVCTVEPLVPAPIAMSPWGRQYGTMSPAYESPGLYRSPFGPTGFPFATTQLRTMNYPLIRKCRLQVVAPGMQR